MSVRRTAEWFVFLSCAAILAGVVAALLWAAWKDGWLAFGLAVWALSFIAALLITMIERSLLP